MNIPLVAIIAQPELRQKLQFVDRAQIDFDDVVDQLLQ